MTSTLRGGGGLTKCRRSKRGCVDLVLWILPKCRQGGPKSQKFCRRHLSMAPFAFDGYGMLSIKTRNLQNILLRHDTDFEKIV